MAALSAEFDYIVAQFGAPSGGGPIAPDRLDSYREHLPQSLIDFYALHGQGLVLNGFFQFCEPTRYAPIAKAVFGDNTDLPGSRCHIIGFSAFGALSVWSEDHGTVSVHLVDGVSSCLSLFGRGAKLPPDQSVAVGLFQLDMEANDAFDADGKPMFKRALKALGPLAAGQVYGFVPLLSLGGPRRVENLKIVPALEHMALLAGAAPVRMVDTSKLATM